MRRRVRIVLVAAGTGVALAVVVAVVASPSAAQTEGPRITLDRVEASPGEPVVITMSDFSEGIVTVAVCGNLATRGSADCNMSASATDDFDPTRSANLTDLVVQAPPMPCPCLVRVSSTWNDEFAVAALVVRGHPVGPIVDVDRGRLVDVAIDAERSPRGILEHVRAALGGPTRYRVTVSVRNLSTETLNDVTLSGSAHHRFNDDAAVLDLDVPGPIEPGQTWTQELESTVPAPFIGTYRWEIAASGAGPTVTADRGSSSLPLLLLVLVAVFVGDAIAIVMRLSRRRRDEAVGADEQVQDVDGWWDEPEDRTAVSLGV